MHYINISYMELCNILILLANHRIIKDTIFKHIPKLHFSCILITFFRNGRLFCVVVEEICIPIRHIQFRTKKFLSCIITI